MAWRLSAAACVLAALTLPGCQARKTYREPDFGWHSPDFTTVFGRLGRAPGATTQDAPIWVLRFGTPAEPFQGEIALDAPANSGRLIGYSGGEMVEVRGRPAEQATTDAYNGRHYVVDSIQLWAGYKQ